MEEIKVSEMLQADSIEKDNAVMIIQDGVNKKASGSIETATGTSLSLTSVADTCKVKSNSKNMFNGKGSGGAVSVTYKLDGSELTLNGTSTNGADIVGATYITTLPAGTYTFSMIKLSGTYIVTQNTGHVTLQKTSSGDTILQTILSELDNGKSTTLTFDSATTIYLRSYANTGITYSNLVVGIQIEEDSTATSYNPYNTEVGICGKNLINSSLFIQGDFSLSNTTTRLVIGQKLYLRAGTYTISTNLNTNVYRYYINTLEGPIGPSYWPQKYNSNWQTSSSFTFTLSSSEEGYFAFIVGKIDGSTLLAQEMANYNFQLENGDTATTYEKFEGQYLDLTPEETKLAFTYDSLTNILSNGSVTIEYNTQSRLLNNDDVIDIVKPVKEYVDRIAEEKSQEIYSTEETKIGTWIDGKPLYRKVVQYTIPSGTTATGISLGIANIRFVQRAEVRFNSVGSGDYVFNSYYSSASDYMRFFMRNTELQIRLGSNSSGFNIVAIVEYTKTTD